MSRNAGCDGSDDDWWTALSRHPFVPDWSRHPTLAPGHLGAVRPNVPKATCFPAKNAAGAAVVSVFLVMTVILIVAGSAAVTLTYRLMGRRVGGDDDVAVPA